MTTNPVAPSQVDVYRDLSPNRALGAMTRLCLSSTLHRRWHIRDVETYFLPPIKAHQYAIYTRADRLVGFATWAFLNANLEDGITERKPEIEIDQWHVGTIPWVIDFVALDRLARPITTHMAREIFPGQLVKGIRRCDDGTCRKVSRFHVVTRTSE